MPSPGIELCYYLCEDWEVSVPWESPFWTFPLLSIFVAWDHHFLISHTPPSFLTLRYSPICLPGLAPMAYL